MTTCHRCSKDDHQTALPSSGSRFPLVKVVTSRMDTSDTLALLHEIDHCITLRVVLKNQMWCC